jgi:hypothetical protein
MKAPKQRLFVYLKTKVHPHTHDEALLAQFLKPENLPPTPEQN